MKILQVNGLWKKRELARVKIRIVQGHHDQKLTNAGFTEHCHCVFVSWYKLAKMVEKSTAQKDRVTGEKGPATELELGTYTLSQSFSHKLLVPVEILRPQSPFCTHYRCAAIQWPLIPVPQGWFSVQCGGSRLSGD